MSPAQPTILEQLDRLIGVLLRAPATAVAARIVLCLPFWWSGLTKLLHFSGGTAEMTAFDSVQALLAQPGPALLHVKVKPMQLVMPPSPFVSPEAVVGMAVYTAKAMLHGKGHDVWEMMVENIP